MVDVNSNAQDAPSDEEFEYIELEEGQELPEGYEYEYVEVPADEVSEMDVVNRGHVLEPEEASADAPVDEVAAADDLSDDMASVEKIDAAIHAPEDDDDKTEAPFPSFLLADNPQNKIGADEEDVSQPTFTPKEAEAQNAAEVSAPVEETVAEVVEPKVPEKNNWQAVPGEVKLDAAQEVGEEIHFQNADDDDKNWQEDTRASLSLEEAKADVSDIHFQKNTISSMDVNDYIEPEAKVTAQEVASTEVPPATKKVLPQVSVAEVEDEPSLNLNENDLSIDDLLQDETDFSADKNSAEEDIVPDVVAQVVEEDLEAVPSDDFLPVPEEAASENKNENDEKVSPLEIVSEDVLPQEDEKAKAEILPPENSLPLEETIAAETKPDEKIEPEILPTEEPVPAPSFQKPQEQPAMPEETYFTDTGVSPEADNFVSAPKVTPPDDKAESVLQINPRPMDFQVEDFVPAELSQAEIGSRLISKQNGIQTFKADADVADILLTDVDFAQNELASWNLILFQKSILPMDKPVAELSLPQQSGLNRYISIVQNGDQKIELFNEENLDVINTRGTCVAVKGKFICGDFGENSGLVIDDFIPVSLADFAGKKLTFAKPASGLLTGPNGCAAFFFAVKHLWVPSSDVAAVDAEKLQYKISKWYSGTMRDKYFEFSAQSESGEFVGNAEMNAIHVNVNNTSYGWNVTFDNGLSMNLRDLREYQTRFGKMPSANGTISYGQKTLKFQNVERIVVYEAAQYFFYS